MEEEIIIGARKTNLSKKENLNIERSYSIDNFSKYVLNFEFD